MESMLLSAMWWTRARVWPRRLQAKPPSSSQPPIRRHPYHHQVESVIASWALVQLLTCHHCLRRASLLVECPCTPRHCPHPRQVGSVAVSLVRAQLPTYQLHLHRASLLGVHLLAQCPRPRPMASAEVHLTLSQLMPQTRHPRQNQVKLPNFGMGPMVKMSCIGMSRLVLHSTLNAAQQSKPVRD